MHEAVFTDECTRVAPSEAVESGLAFDFDIAEYCMEIRHHPSHGILLGSNLDFGMCGIVDALNLFKQILTGQQQGSLRHVFAGEEHLRQTDDALYSPSPLMLQFTLELPAQTLGGVDILHAHFRHIHLEFTRASGPEGSVASHFEIRDSLLGDDCL